MNHKTGTPCSWEPAAAEAAGGAGGGGGTAGSGVAMVQPLGVLLFAKHKRRQKQPQQADPAP